MVAIIVFKVAEAYSKAGLQFRPSLNGIQVLNQKLNFKVLTDHSLQLGPLLISEEQFRIENLSRRESFKLRFIGPSVFLSTTEIVLRDPSKMAVWRKKPIHPEIDLKSGQAFFDESSEAQKILKILSALPYFNFCLYAEKEPLKINLCTPDYRVKNQNGAWIFSRIGTNETENRVIINGVEVHGEGEIQFSKDINSISLIAKLVSGLLLEVRLQEVPVELMDYEWDPAQTKLSLRYRRLQHFEAEEFNLEQSVSVDPKRPFFYLETECKIPLKQELVLEKPLVSEREKPILRRDHHQTYNSKVQLELKIQKDDQLKVLSVEDRVQKKGENGFWEIRNLVPKESNVRHLEIKNTRTQKISVATYEIFRGLPWEANLLISVSNKDRQSISRKYANEVLLGVNYHLSPYSRHWLVGAQLTSSHYAFHLMYQLKSEMQTVASSWSIGGGIESFDWISKKHKGFIALEYFVPTNWLGLIGDKVGGRLNFETRDTPSSVAWTLGFGVSHSF